MASAGQVGEEDVAEEDVAEVDVAEEGGATGAGVVALSLKLQGAKTLEASASSRETKYRLIKKWAALLPKTFDRWTI